MEIFELFKQVVIGLPRKKQYSFSCDLPTFKKQIRLNLGRHEDLIEIKGRFSGLDGKRLNIDWTRTLKYLRYGKGRAHTGLKVKSNIISFDEGNVILESKYYVFERFFFWIIYGFAFLIFLLQVLIKQVLFGMEFDMESFVRSSMTITLIILVLVAFYMPLAYFNMKKFEKGIFTDLEFKEVES